MGKKKLGSSMKLTSINLPETYIADLDELVRQGMYPNRSEAVRMAIKDTLMREMPWAKSRQMKNQ